MTLSHGQIGAGPASPVPVPAGQPAAGRPERKPWFRFLRKWALAFWLAVAAVGLVVALVPVAFPAQVLLSSAIVGAGIAGLLAEFTFSLDRREDDLDLQVQLQRYSSLEDQVGQVDNLMKKTEIVSINQMFKLGVDLYQVRFAEADEADVFEAEAKDLAEILGLTAAVQQFLGNRYLRAADGLPPAGEDPFPDLKRAVQIRYSKEAREALMAGSIVSTVMHTAGGLADQSYRTTMASVLRGAVKLLYLLPVVSDNLLRAIDELEEEAYRPNYLGGYLSLFIFYLGYRMTGENPIVVPLFESPVSLAQPSAIARITQTLAQLSGQPAAETEPVTDSGTPAASGGRGPARGSQPQPGSERATARPGRKPWFVFLRKWSLVFWLAVSAAGLVVALVPVTFPAQVLLSSAVVGAGIAGLISEFTFCSDRRQADSDLADQRRRYDRLKGHIGQVDQLVKKSEIVAVNQMFRLGMDLYWVRFAPEGQVAGFKSEARELADFLGLTVAVDKFLSSAYLRPSAPPPDGQDPFPALLSSIALRYAQDGLEAFRAGSTLGVVLNLGLPDGKFPEEAIAILKKAMDLLYLLPEVQENMLRAIHETENGSCEPRSLLLYLTLFSMYLTYRMTGDNAEIVPLFESRVSLAQPSIVTEMLRILGQVAGERPGEAPEPAVSGSGVSGSGVSGSGVSGSGVSGGGSLGRLDQLSSS